MKRLYFAWLLISVALGTSLVACGGAYDQNPIAVAHGEGECQGLKLGWSTAVGPWGKVAPTDFQQARYGSLAITVNDPFTLTVCISNWKLHSIYQLEPGSHSLEYSKEWHYTVSVSPPQ